MKKRTTLTVIAVIISTILTLAVFISLRSGSLSDRGIGGEGLLLLIPAITYFICRNISLSFDVFYTPKEDYEDFHTQVITAPKQLKMHNSDKFRCYK